MKNKLILLIIGLTIGQNIRSADYIGKIKQVQEIYSALSPAEKSMFNEFAKEQYKYYKLAQNQYGFMDKGFAETLALQGKITKLRNELTKLSKLAGRLTFKIENAAALEPDQLLTPAQGFKNVLNILDIQE